MLVILLSSAHGFGLRELPNDGTDQDGDGGDAIRQDFRATFPKPAVPPLNGWVATGGASFGNDVATVPAFGHVTWSGAASFQSGEVNLVLDTDLIVGSCTVAVTWHELSPPSGPYSNTFSITSPTLVSTLTANAPISVDAIDLGCGVGQMTVDWLVFQNGVEVYPPVGDIDITWEDVDKPGGGYESAVTLRGTIEDDPMSPISLWAASDVGGIAQWSDVDHAWKTRNGTWPDMLYQASELAMFDVVETAFNEVLAISGEIDTVEYCDALGDCQRMVRGRLMASSDAGGTWIAEADTYQSPGSGTPVVAANRRLSPFLNADGDWAKTHAAGRLLEHAAGSVFVANHVPATSTAPAGFPPLLLREDGPAGSPADICALSNVDPTLELPRATYDEVTGWHNILSALAWIGEPGQETLLVGYRQRDRLGASGNIEDSSLFRCAFSLDPVPTCADYETMLECYPIAEGIGIDVADIEVSDSGGVYSAWIADYGYRYSSGTCDATDPDSSCAGALTTPSVWRWDVDLLQIDGTDDTVTDISSGLGYNGAISGVLASGNYLYAFTVQDRDAWYSVEPRHWRIDLADARMDVDSWITLSDKNSAPVGEEQRDGKWDSTDTWGDDQEALGNWASTTDGVFYDGQIVGGGLIGIWAFDGLEGVGFDGYLDPSGYDDDYAPTHFSMFDSADFSGASTFQGTVDAAASYGWDGRLHVAAADLGYYRQDVGARSEVPPQAEVFTLHGNAVAAVPVRDGLGSAVWVAMGATGKDDTGNAIYYSGILRSADDGENFCYQANYNQGGVLRTHSGRRFVGSRYDLPGPIYGSSVSGFPDWPACDPATEPDTTKQGDSLAGWGFAADIEALDESVAIAAFQTYLDDGRLAYTLDGSVTWVELDGPSAAEFPMGAPVQDVFTGTPTMDLVDRYTSYTSATNWQIEVIFVARSAETALWRVHVDASAPTDATWTHIGLLGCVPDLPEDKVTGVVANPWADSFVVWGGWNRWQPSVEEGGACVSNLDGTAQQTLLHPDDPNYAFEIAEVVPHPYLYRTWYFAPIVGSGTQDACARSWDTTGWDYDWSNVYDACAAPFPFVVQRSGGGWRSAPLSIAGLPSLKAIDLEARSTGTSVELAYTTQGSGTFRGTTSW